MGTLSSDRLKILQEYTGACDAGDGRYALSAEEPFTYEDIAVIQDYYYNGGGGRQIHMSDVPGEICWRNKGEYENKKLADAIDETCVDVLGGSAGAENKCKELYTIIDRHADQPWYEDAARYAGYAALGLTGTWAVFGPGMSLWHLIQKTASKGAGLPLLLMELIWPQEVFDQAIQNSPANRYSPGYSTSA